MTVTSDTTVYDRSMCADNMRVGIVVPRAAAARRGAAVAGCAGRVRVGSAAGKYGQHVRVPDALEPRGGAARGRTVCDVIRTITRVRLGLIVG